MRVITSASRLIRLLSWSLLDPPIGGQTPRQLRLRAQAVVILTLLKAPQKYRLLYVYDTFTLSIDCVRVLIYI
jgi:hypothetical protein